MAIQTGGRLIAGNSKLFSQAVGVVQLAYAGYDLGKTNADTTISPDQDILDVTYQQTGTKPADHIRTGLEWTVSATFAEISTSLISLLQGGVSSANKSAASDSLRLTPELYQSMVATESGALKIIAVDSDSGLSTREVDHWSFYQAIPIIEGEIVNWGADSQRSFPVMFKIKAYQFPEPHSYSAKWGLGYVGNPSHENFPPIDWPDVVAPRLVSAVASSATQIAIEFSKDIQFYTGSNLNDGTIVATVNGVFKTPTRANTTINSSILTLGFAANTFKTGDIITLTVTEKALKDKSATPNDFPGLFGYQVRNDV